MDFLKMAIDILLMLFDIEIKIKDAGSKVVFGLCGFGYEIKKSITIRHGGHSVFARH